MTQSLFKKEYSKYELPLLWTMNMTGYSGKYNATRIAFENGAVQLTKTNKTVTAVIDLSNRWLSLPQSIVDDIMS